MEATKCNVTQQSDADTVRMLDERGQLFGAFSIPAAQYHAIQRASKSGLDNIARSPAFYQWRKRVPLEQTPDMLLGSAVDMAFFEPHLFNDTYARIPKCDRRTNEGKAAYAKHVADAEGKQVLSEDVWLQVETMSERLRRDPLVRQLTTNGTPQVSLFWNQRVGEREIACKGRPDFVHSDGIIVDLKCTSDITPSLFAKKAADRRYHVQAAMYLEAANAVYGQPFHEFVLIVIESKPPYEIAPPMRLPLEAIERGRELMLRDLETYANCTASGRWPTQSELAGVVDLRLPSYAFVD